MGHAGAGSRAIAIAAIIVYLGLSIDHLAVFPPVGEDEPWIAAAPYKLATEGVYGSDLFAGYYGVDRHNYQHMPLNPLLQAAVFKVAGAGVIQMRLLPVAFGLALLIVVFMVGRQAGGDRVGALAVVLMIGLRVAAGDGATGILLLDRARVNRYDIAVPVFGFVALWAFARAERDRSTGWYVATGLLAGLSSLSHLFGAFWLPVFVVAIAYRERWSARAWRAAAWVVLGFAAPWLPWAAYIATGWSDYLGQMRFVSARLDVFNPAFYLSNTLHGGGPISLDWALETIETLPLLRVGTWATLVGLPLAVVIAARRQPDGDRDPVRLLAAAALAQLVMFAALLQVKTTNYMIGLWPFAPLLLAWLAIWSWDRRVAVVRVALAAVLALVLIEGGARVAQAWTAARQVTPYDRFEADVAGCIPDGSLVLGLQHYWLGLRQYRYRTWLMPAIYANPRYHQPPLPLDEAIERVNPDVILIDRHMAALFQNAAGADNPNHALHVGFTRFMDRRGAAAECVVRDRTYGDMTVYRVPRLKSEVKREK